MVTREELPDKLTVKETADILHLRPVTIKVLVSQGELRYVGEVGDRDIDTDSIVEYVNRKYGGGRRGTQARDPVGGPGDSGPEPA